MNRKLPILALLLLLTAPIWSGAALASGGKKEEAAADGPSYVPLTPALVVNLANERRAQFLQLSVELYVENAKNLELVNLHMPAIRDRLIAFLGGRNPDEVQAVENREQLRADALAQIRETMTALAGAPAVAGIFFTSFIVQ